MIGSAIRGGAAVAATITITMHPALLVLLRVVCGFEIVCFVKVSAMIRDGVEGARVARSFAGEASKSGVGTAAVRTPAPRAMPSRRRGGPAPHTFTHAQPLHPGKKQ